MKKIFLSAILLFTVSGCGMTDQTKEGITVVSPQPNTEISSPLTITGEASGTWFFEATFPVKLVDTNGAVIAQGNVQTMSDWQTEEMVPFEGVLEFTTDVREGELILRKDNPSGLPENGGQFLVPVKFK